jgi:hypothetical protein
MRRYSCRRPGDRAKLSPSPPDMQESDYRREFSKINGAACINLNSAVAGLKMAHLLEITSAFEFAVLTLTVPGLRLRKYQNPLCFRVSAAFSSSLTAEFRIKRIYEIDPLRVPQMQSTDAYHCLHSRRTLNQGHLEVAGDR